MKSKPIVMDHFSVVHTAYILDFDFSNNITILTGEAATGKTTSFSIMRVCMAVNPDIICINYQDYQKDIKKLIASETGKLKVVRFRETGYTYVQEEKNVLMDVEDNVAYGKEIRGRKKVSL